MDSITITDLQNAKQDVDTIAAVANSPDPTALDRLGATRRTLTGKFADIDADWTTKKAGYDSQVANSIASVTSAKNDAQTAATQAQTYSQNILVYRGIFGSTADALSKGVTSITSLVGGSGGTNGTFDLSFSGGGGSGAAGRFTVSAGAVVSTVITYSGVGYTSAPTVSFAASTGLTGASGTAVIANNTDSGEYFHVPSTDTAESLILYKNNSGSALDVKHLLGAGIVTGNVPPGYAWAVVDANGNAAFGVTEAGVPTFKQATVDTLNATTSNVTNLNPTTVNIPDSGGTLNVAEGSFSRLGVPGYLWGVADANKKIAIGLQDDGTLNVKALKVTSINGSAPGSIIARSGLAFPAQINYWNFTGQSLAEGAHPSGTNITTVKEYDNIGFPARVSSPSAFVDLTVANTEAISGTTHAGEWYGLGACGYLKERILKVSGLTYDINDFQLCASNNGYGGYTLAQLSKGQSPYTIALSHVQSAHDLAVGLGKTMKTIGTCIMQGESDATTDKATYKAAFIQLAKDYDADYKSITGQKEDNILFTYQNCSVDRRIAEAHLECSNESPLVVVACPMYQFNYVDTMHIDAVSEKWVGAYFSLAMEQVVLRGRRDWKPLQPIAHAVLGNTIDLIFNKSGLVLDTTNLPQQTNYGFDVLDGSSVAQTISSVQIIATNRVRITMSGAVSAGWTVRYGYGSATGRTDYLTAGFGNLRDSQGDDPNMQYTFNDQNGSPVTKRMDNWSVIFKYAI